MNGGNHLTNRNLLERGQAALRRLGIDQDLPIEQQIAQAVGMLRRIGQDRNQNGAQVSRSRRSRREKRRSRHSRTSSRSKKTDSTKKGKSKRRSYSSSKSSKSRKSHSTKSSKTAKKRDEKPRRRVAHEHDASRKKGGNKRAGAQISRTKGTLTKTGSTLDKSRTKKVAVQTLPQKFNQKSFIDAAKRLADQGYTQVVTALSNNKDGQNKIWALFRNPKSTRAGGRVTLWGSAKEPNRHTYGGAVENDDQLITQKLNKGYVKNAALKRVAASVVRKALKQK